MQYRLVVRHLSDEVQEVFIDTLNPMFVPAIGDLFAPLVRINETEGVSKGVFSVVSRIFQYEQAGEHEPEGSEDGCTLFVDVKPY